MLPRMRCWSSSPRWVRRAPACHYCASNSSKANIFWPCSPDRRQALRKCRNSRRPDIQAAEALLHVATAEYGVAVASLYPQLDLSASLGSQTLTTGALFGGGSSVWNLMAQLTQPLLDPGLPARKRASLAALDAAAANYQGIVLDALRDVADVLRALDHDAQSQRLSDSAALFQAMGGG